MYLLYCTRCKTVQNLPHNGHWCYCACAQPNTCAARKPVTSVTPVFYGDSALLIELDEKSLFDAQKLITTTGLRAVGFEATLTNRRRGT
jgi:hypothetical protein